MPTMDQVIEYSQALPELYRWIFWAIPKIDPGRRAGDGVAIASLATYLRSLGLQPDFQDVRDACLQLVEGGFVEMNGVFVNPTPLGEELLVAVRGKYSPDRLVPALPRPTW